MRNVDAKWARMTDLSPVAGVLVVVLAVVVVMVSGCSELVREDAPVPLPAYTGDAGGDVPSGSDPSDRPHNTCDGVTPCDGCCTSPYSRYADGGLVPSTCVSGLDATACGYAGSACQNCRDEKDGHDGTCVARTGTSTSGGTCNVTTGEPPSPEKCGGCWRHYRYRYCVAGDRAWACGSGGADCVECNDDEDCVGHTCKKVCNARTCDGCCDGEKCLPGTDLTMCGHGAASCRDCSSSALVCGKAGVCQNPACNPDNCPGCCQGDSCVSGFTNGACGSEGKACADCAASTATCTASAASRSCTTCPSLYAGCAAGTTEAVLPQHTGACSSSSLANAEAACAFGPASAACTSFFAGLATIEPGCGTCLTPFKVPFLDAASSIPGKGIAACVAPFVTAVCRHSIACGRDCLDASCGTCSAGGASTWCKTTASSGQCIATSGDASACFTSALAQASSAFCDPAAYSSSFGAWLAAVGARFCGP